MNSVTAYTTSPAATKMSSTPVAVKNRPRSMRTPSAKIAQPIAAATSSPASPPVDRSRDIA